jgi:mono/diheme cytochrome c family protein
MIPPRMSRPLKVLLTLGAALVIGALTGACGTEKIALSPSNPLYRGAVLFNQRCSGCHTLSYAATHGSAQFVRTKEFNNGPNFDIRCERPVTRVLYAIENGGFSGQIMPQNIVVGPDAVLVAKFVATYAGLHAPNVPGIVPCSKVPIGTIPMPSAGTTSTGATSTTPSSAYAAKPASTTSARKVGGRPGRSAHRRSHARRKKRHKSSRP